jgi:hypothetical protein
VKKLTGIASFLFLVTFVLSCGVKPSFIDPSFIYSTIKTEGIAILPVGGGQADFSIREEAGRNFGEELAEKYPKVKVISPQDSGSKLTEVDLMEEYIGVVSAYQMAGTLKPDKLDKIGKAFGVRYLVIPIIQNYEKEEVKDGYKYTIVLEVQTFDLEKKSSVFQCLTEGEATPSGWMFGLFSGTPKDAAVRAAKKAAKAFPKPE